MDDKILYFTHQHLKGISKQTEEKNWNNGILTLNDLIAHNGPNATGNLNNLIKKSIEDLKIGQVDVFKHGLAKSEYYRIAFSFPEHTMFINIETTGLSKEYSYITVIGWYLNGQYRYCLYGNSLQAFIDDLTSAKVIVTFNGSLFDLPFIQHKYSKLTSMINEKAHIDLRFYSKRYGYTGGQRQIEDNLGFKRPSSLNNTDSKEAISLWYKFLKDDNNALKRLLYYNCYSILGMVYLFNQIFIQHIYQKQLPKFIAVKQFKRKYKADFIKLNQNQLETSKNEVCKNITFFKHHHLKRAYGKVIVGIDLTGSESKASGCASIYNNLVTTQLLHTDEDIINFIVSVKAELVSIDSPLSLPLGRTSVFDDDPKRQEIGIMRSSERIMKQRGVNIYPALIPSMQRLTKRGIELADKIRQLGIPAIESFPGAAQDILQIPRKKTDLHFLKQGLIDFGITGNFIDTKVSHDELDAITAALVGQFYLSDYYEAIGCADENYLIIPLVTKNSIK